MTTLLLIFWVSEIVALASYIYSCWPVRTRVSLFIKMMCSSIFVAYGITLSKVIRGGSGIADSVILLILWALIFGWIGDLLLGLSHQVKSNQSTIEEKDRNLLAQFKNRGILANALGILAFLTGHVLYCVAFLKALQSFGIPLKWYTFLCFALPFILYAILGVTLKLGKHLIPLGVYFVFVSLMFGLSTTLGIGLWNVSHLFALCLMLGSCFFSLSDLGLSLETYGGERFNHLGLRVFRQIAYFTGQMLLASTVLFFKAM